MSDVTLVEIILGCSLVGSGALGTLWWKSRSHLKGHHSRWSLLSQGCVDVLWHWSARTKRFYATDRVWDWVDPPPGGIQELFDRRYELIHPGDVADVRRQVQKVLAGEQDVLDVEFRVTFPGRTERWFRVRGHFGEKGRKVHMAGSWSDVTEAKTLGSQLWGWANLDPLTKLANRRYLLEHLTSLQGTYSLLLIDIDEFSALNEAFDQSSGDQYLEAIARTLRTLFRAEDFLARWGSDEFAVVLQGGQALAETAARRIHQALRAPLLAPQNNWILGASIGVVPGHGPSIDTPTMILEAAQALHRAQKLGGGQTVVFSHAIGAELRRRRLVERRLTVALDEGRLRMVYQPQFRAHDRSVAGFEALARWDDPELGPVSPTEFIPLAESLGLVPRLGLWALDQACQFLANQPVSVRTDLRLSVNVSVLQLRDPGFSDQAEAVVRQRGLAPRSIELEITESFLMQSFEQAIRTVSALREKGFRIALDDFGKGYSSLSYLKVLSLDTLKIDKEFLDDVDHRALLGSIIQMGKLLNLEVVAEGIEHEDQLAYLVDQGCHLVQGFLLAPPLEAQAAQDLLDPTTSHQG